MMKYLLILGLVILILAGGYFYIKPSLLQNSNPQKYTGLVEKIRVANIGEYSIFNIIAKENGYFEENGLDVTVTEYDAGPSAMGALINGKADFTVASDFVGVANIFNNPNIRVISEASRHKVFNVLARSDKGIKTPSDLKGKKIGVTKKSAGEYFLNRFLTFNNLKESDLNVIDLVPAQMLEKFQSGEIDAVLIFDPHAYNLKKILGDKAILWSAQEDQDTFALFYSTDSFIKDHPAVVERYLKAIIQAEEFVSKNPDKAQNVIITSRKYPDDYVKYMWKNFDFEVSLDQELLLDMENQARFEIENKLTKETKAPNYLDYIYFDALKALKPESVTIVH